MRTIYTAREKGFTLFELLIVITIIGILAGVTLTVMNHNRHMGAARNMRRRIDVHTIALATAAFITEKGEFPSEVTDTDTEICRDGIPDCTGMINLWELLLYTKYLTSMPRDMLCLNPYGTCYTIRKQGDRAIIRAPLAENGEVIEVVR